VEYSWVGYQVSTTWCRTKKGSIPGSSGMMYSGIRGAISLFHDRGVVSTGLGFSCQGLCFLMEPVRGFLSIGRMVLSGIHSPVNSLAASQVLPTFKGNAVILACWHVSRRVNGINLRH